jgi:hypothetical protein
MDKNKLLNKASKAEKDEFTFKLKPKYSNYLTGRLVPEDLLSQMHSHFQETQTLGPATKEISLGVLQSKG